jgi:hypothetical protein
MLKAFSPDVSTNHQWQARNADEGKEKGSAEIILFFLPEPTGCSHSLQKSGNVVWGCDSQHSDRL